MADALELKQSRLARCCAADCRSSSAASARRSPASCCSPSSDERTQLWHERVKEVNWELFDRGTEAFTWYALEELVKAAQQAGLAADAPHGRETEALRRRQPSKLQLGKPFDAAAIQPFHDAARRA